MAKRTDADYRALVLQAAAAVPLSENAREQLSQGKSVGDMLDSCANPEIASLIGHGIYLVLTEHAEPPAPGFWRGVEKRGRENLLSQDAHDIITGNLMVAIAQAAYRHRTLSSVGDAQS